MLIRKGHGAHYRRLGKVAPNIFHEFSELVSDPRMPGKSYGAKKLKICIAE
jgi:hypothetical protein